MEKTFFGFFHFSYRKSAAKDESFFQRSFSDKERIRKEKGFPNYTYRKISRGAPR
jgi:hypothetical protein